MKHTSLFEHRYNLMKVNAGKQKLFYVLTISVGELLVHARKVKMTLKTIFEQV
jgi:hypothetical protein